MTRLERVLSAFMVVAAVYETTSAQELG